MNPIDCHVLLREENKPRFFGHLLPKLEKETNVHILQAAGDYGYARHAGYKRGAAPYVTFIDDDDDFKEGMFTEMLRTLRSGPPDAVGAYADTVLVSGDATEWGNSTGVSWCARCMVDAFPFMQGSVLVSRAKAIVNGIVMVGEGRWADQLLYARLATRGRWVGMPAQRPMYHKTVPGKLSLKHAHLENQARLKVAQILSSKASQWNSDCKDCLERAKARLA
jgi:hypothetical protein